MIEFDAALRRQEFALHAQFKADDGVTVLFGPSGSGKTTILELLSGLARPDAGQITFRGRRLVDTGQGVFLPPHKRQIGFVFQDSQLFPHLTVDQNLRFGGWFSRKRSVSAADVIEILGIGDLLQRRPARLSGGEKQRVAIARALLAGPELLLMDEPLSSLDQARKQDVLQLIEAIRHRFGVPIVYVTHSVDELRFLATQVVILQNGRVVFSGNRDAALKVLKAETVSAPPGAAPSFSTDARTS